MSYDPISQDPPNIDTEYPSKMMDVLFESHGVKLNGVMYVPPGADPHPTILLLHGFPGHENNVDLAQIFRRAGYTVMVFHYRGAWGSEGDFTFSHVLEDTESALHFLRDSQTIQHFNIDPENIIVVGHSMGGWAALHMAGKGLVNRVASIAGVNIGVWGETVDDSDEAKRYSMDYFEANLSPLSGATAEALVNELVQYMDDFDTMRLANTLSQLDVLLVAGERDDGVPVSLHHTPLVYMLERKNAENLTHIVLDADHVFSNKRLTLARTLLDWLDGA
jgi:uncharacterized protein